MAAVVSVGPVGMGSRNAGLWESAPEHRQRERLWSSSFPGAWFPRPAVPASHLSVRESSWYPHTAGHVAGTQDSSVQAAQTRSLPRAALDTPCVLQS